MRTGRRSPEARDEVTPRSCPRRGYSAAVSLNDLALVCGRRGEIAEQRLHEGGLIRMHESCIVAALETDTRTRIAREPAAADRAAVVTRVDENMVWQLEQALDRGVEFFRRRLRATGGVQVRTTDVA